MPSVRLDHTAALTPAEREAFRALLYEVFDDLDETDVEHALGGMHATVWDDSVLVAHGAVVQRRLLHDDRTVRCGYLEGVAVRADHRRRGLARAVVTELTGVVRRAYDVGALGATDEAVPLSTSLGWRRWGGRAFALTPAGVVETPGDADSIFVLPVDGVPLHLTGRLTCDWREGDVW